LPEEKKKNKEIRVPKSPFLRPTNISGVGRNGNRHLSLKEQSRTSSGRKAAKKKRRKGKRPTTKSLSPTPRRVLAGKGKTIRKNRGSPLGEIEVVVQK